MDLMRAPDWAPRLTRYLAACARRPYQPGQHDCALFAAGALAAMGGPDLAAPYRGRYRTLSGGRRVLRADGFADHVALAAAHLPLRAGPARPGDLVVVPTDDGPALGVVQGALVYAVTPAGLGLVPLPEGATVFGVD